MKTLLLVNLGSLLAMSLGMDLVMWRRLKYSHLGVAKPVVSGFCLVLFLVWVVSYT